MATADMQVVMQLTQNFFFRNNPITAITASVAQVIDKVVNFESHRKLMKYRCLLYKQQMSSLERNLDAGSLSPRGERMNRLY